MPKFAANLNWLFTEVDFIERFSAAAVAGFKGIECLFPYEFNAVEVAKLLGDNQLEAVLINAPPGDWSAGERGLGCLSGRQREFRDSVNQAIDYAQAIECPQIHIMAGIAGIEARELFIENLHFAAEACAGAGIRGLIEPINDIDMPGYFLTRPDQAMEILGAVANPALSLQLDLYHAARMGLDIDQALDTYAGAIAHIQVAGVPQRTEPDKGDIDFLPLFDRLDAVGYDGWVGCEYRPATTTIAGLAWASGHLNMING